MHEHVLIVGATSPLASETTAAFIARGSRISLVSRSGRPALDRPADGVRGYAFDLANLAGIGDFCASMAAEYGPFTRMCFFQRYRGGADNPWDGEYAISLRATSRFIEEGAAQPAVEGDRSIVIISSPADSGVVLEQSASYHAVKAGLSQMVRYYAVALGGRRIRVNGIKPAIVLKPRAKEFYDRNPGLVALFNRVTPLGRMGWPADIANAVLFLSSEQASFITGQILSVDGGLSLHEAGSLARLACSVFNPEMEDPRWKRDPS